MNIHRVDFFFVQHFKKRLSDLVSNQQSRQSHLLLIPQSDRIFSFSLSPSQFFVFVRLYVMDHSDIFPIKSQFQNHTIPMYKK